MNRGAHGDSPLILAPLGVLNGKPPPQTSVRTLGGGSTSLQGPRAIIAWSDARLAYLIKGAKMLRTKHLKMAVVPMTLLALLSTAVPVASAQETTDESFYELTTTPSGGDMIVGEPGTTILFCLFYTSPSPRDCS